VPDETCQFVASDGVNKIVVAAFDPETSCLTATADETKDWCAAAYNYQIISSTGLVESGRLKVLPNLLYSHTTDSYWKTVVRQIEERLAGKAVDAAYSVSVDGKSISYMSVSELYRLLDFARGKLAEEEAEEEGVSHWDKNNQHKIKYFWR